jgi:exopolysaccharide production protein ExoZ
MNTVVPIQALRAVAALSVSLVHFSVVYWQALGRSGLGPLYPMAAGVDLFFVISGFVMIYSSEQLFGRPGAPVIFVRHRLARIVPIYWLTTTIAIWLMREHFDPRSIFGSYFFIPFANGNGSLNPLYGVGWTLNFEMYFYSVFALCLFFRRATALALVTGALLSAVALARMLVLQSAPLLVWTDPIILEFLFGALIAVLYRLGATLPNPVRLFVVTAGIVTIWQFHAPELPSHYRWAQWGIPAAMIVSAFVLGTHRWTESWLGCAAKNLGDASYSLYLLHGVVLILAAALANRFHAVLIFLLLGYLAAVALSLLSYRYFERPLTDFLKGNKHRLPSPTGASTKLFEWGRPVQ